MLDDIKQVVTDSIKTILPQIENADIKGNVHLSDLGADSVDRIEIISIVLKKLKLNVPLNKFSQIRNIDEMIKLLTEIKTS